MAAAGSDGSRPAPATVLAEVGSVPASTFDAVGFGRVQKNNLTLTRLSGPAAGTGGAKPVILAAIAEWCPHCVANSWVLALVLERFGTLTGLRTVNSGTYYGKHGRSPAFSNTHGLSFIDASYSSQYFVFEPVIRFARDGASLEHETKPEKAMLPSLRARPRPCPGFRSASSRCESRAARETTPSAGPFRCPPCSKQQRGGCGALGFTA